ncbi:uncharacterized protein LOC133831083 isoform X2 [Humulus lupulus]|uniref:uncharacterized protein LOC133831083 isoform X2 n=1 Tax=Humulus lupulus TaxID=3486 RepID=UPI002B41865B|nr:uncharacterized protein LOC133831083 isoform X2 [Humulus lupulus]
MFGSPAFPIAYGVFDYLLCPTFGSSAFPIAYGVSDHLLYPTFSSTVFPHQSPNSLGFRFLDVWLPRTDGHTGLENLVALKFVGIDNSSKDSDGRTVMRTASRDVYQWADSSRKMRIRVCLFSSLETWSHVHPYVDEPQNYCLQVADYEKMFKLTLAANNHRLQVAIHAIGDRSNDRILDMYESIISKNGIRDRRFWS